MKKDLISVLLVAVLGTAVAYFVTNMFVKNPEVVKYKTVDAASLSSDLAQPNENVFNYLALNPTVEVYVGGCEEYDVNGECVGNSSYAQLLQQEKIKQKEALGYYDIDGYFHKYEYDEEGFYDYNGDFFEFVDNGYKSEDGTFYRFDAAKPGYYDGAEYKDVNNGGFEIENDEEDELDKDEDEKDSSLRVINENSSSSRRRLIEED